MLRRHVVILDNAIYEAETSEFRDALKHSLDRCRALQDDINKLDTYCHPVLEMNQVTVSELANFACPPQDVHDIMKATYLLLGENMRTLKVSWFNPYLTNEFSHHYQLGESTFIFRGVRSDF